ncbi:MAG: hypothetical protein Q4D73_00705 [Actinomycetaceae bacterium]|nr:hypothetical protein [Actinomycetaceae bacterium]
MTRPFQKVLIVGQPLFAGAPSDLLSLPKQQCPDVTFQAWDTSVAGLTELLRAQNQVVINLDELTALEKWAPPGQVTTVIADHLRTPRNLFDTQLPSHEWGAGIGLLATWAGWSYQRVLDLFNLPKNQLAAQVAILIREARQGLNGRRLQVLGLSERPLLGADSVLVADPDSLPVWGLAPQDLAAVTDFYQAATDYLASQTVLKLSGVAERDLNPARAEGSGVGHGLGALPALLHGFRGRALETFLTVSGLEAELAADTLVVAAVPQLHPQTAAMSVLGVLKDLTVAASAPLIVFSDESSLSKHELFEWNVTACYGGRGRELTPADYSRILTQTWLRTR